jgi:hypothetical protein
MLLENILEDINIHRLDIGRICNTKPIDCTFQDFDGHLEAEHQLVPLKQA